MVENICALMGQGKWDEAKDQCRNLIFQLPTKAEGHAYLGICLMREGKLEEALTSFERATVLNPHYWEAGTKLVQCLDRLQRYDEAYEAATQWEHEHPGDKTLLALIDGLSHHITPKITDQWQKSARPMHHNVTFTR